MGMFRETGSQEIDIIKEMAEGLGSTGLKVDELLQKVQAALERVQELISAYNGSGSDRPEISVVNQSIAEYNAFVDQAQDALRWLLIQREACGFRIHRDVDHHYPIPSRIKLLRG